MGQTLLEYRVLRKTVPVVSGFGGEIDLAQVPLDQTWRIEQLTIAVFGLTAVSGLAGQAVLVYDQPQGHTSSHLTDRLQPTIPVDATTLQTVNGPAGPTLAADFNDRGSPITILGGDALAVVFATSLSVGWTVGLRVQFGVYQGAAGTPTPVAT